MTFYTVPSNFWKLKGMEKGDNPCPKQIVGDKGEPLRTDEEKGSALLQRYKRQLQPDGIYKQLKRPNARSERSFRIASRRK